ncbi:Low temperature viability protein-domain-containing protein [Leucosporidium creatinivorum]|uniref:Low temperature viability protein-domain-containing protein n=1 Tax=Leucosporidium creatinivorum TaxID=106004 RepID=A0A1Y2CI20_9BASI|nr:Low temperature viability protein-domain-containing protein [Leucosporidium creatinivorum]
MSLWRKPGTKTFQLVHRSQRDPLINDPDASDRVLKEIDTSQQKKGSSSSKKQTQEDFATNEAELGDAAAYGIYFDDAEYNYMQHLRTVGDHAESYLVEAPVSKKGKGKAARLDDGGFTMKDDAERGQPVDLPEDSLPSHPLDEASYLDITSNKAPTMGLQPDLDPRVREVLEALDDEAYAVDDGEGTDEEEDFFEGIMKGGEVEERDVWEDDDEDVDDVTGGVSRLDVEDDDNLPLEARIARFKAQQGGRGADSDDEDDYSEGGDTIADLKAASARRPPRKGASMAGSQFSMTSSAMFRNEGLRTLDDRFDQIEKLYEEDSDESWGGESDEEDDYVPDLGPPREDLDQIMDDFLSRYEVLGGKMRHVLDPTPGVEGNAGKLDRIRKSLATMDLGEAEEGEDPELAARRIEKAKILAAVERQWKEEAGKKNRIKMEYAKPKERWDCETVLSTYSNVSNHPRLLRVRENGPRPARIRIDEKTGFPVVEGGEEKKDEEEDEEMEEESDDGAPRPETIKRPRGETAEQKKARKEAVKQERASRRAEKKTTKETFGNEFKRQKRIAGKAVAGGAAADIRVGEGVRRLA